MYVHTEVSPTVSIEAYSQDSVYRIAVLVNFMLYEICCMKSTVVGEQEVISP